MTRITLLIILCAALSSFQTMAKINWPSVASKWERICEKIITNSLGVSTHGAHKHSLLGPRCFHSHNLSILLILGLTVVHVFTLLLPLPSGDASAGTRPSSSDRFGFRPARRRLRRERKAFNGAVIYYLPRSSSFGRRRLGIILSLSPAVKSDQV